MRYALAFTLLFVALLLVLGCAQNPQQVMEGKQIAIKLTQPREKAARCMARNIENYPPSWREPYVPSVDDTEESTNLVVRVLGSHAIAAVRVIPHFSGSTALIYLSGVTILPSDFVEVMVKGC